MKTKLTLLLDSEIIDQAKKHASEKNTSLSLMFENYLRRLTAGKKTPKAISPMVRSLMGSLSSETVDQAFLTNPAKK